MDATSGSTDAARTIYIESIEKFNGGLLVAILTMELICVLWESDADDGSGVISNASEFGL